MRFFFLTGGMLMISAEAAVFPRVSLLTASPTASLSVSAGLLAGGRTVPTLPETAAASVEDTKVGATRIFLAFLAGGAWTVACPGSQGGKDGRSAGSGRLGNRSGAGASFTAAVVVEAGGL